MAKDLIKSKRKTITKKKKKIKKKKLIQKKLTKKKKKVVESVKPVSTPVGSVHFEEFLKKCKSSKLNLTPNVKSKKEKKKGIKKIKKLKKGGKTKKKSKVKKRGKVKTKKGGKKQKNKKLKTKKNVKLTPQLKETHPPLFPLIKALLLPTDDDPLEENLLFSVRLIIYN